jgi:hypothetical protein
MLSALLHWLRRKWRRNRETVAPQARILVFTGAAGTAWDDPGNWVPGPPLPSDEVVLSPASSTDAPPAETDGLIS